MATPKASESPEADAYHVTQAALALAAADTLDDLWPDLDPLNLVFSVAALQPVIAATGSQFSSAAVSHAADYYEALRAAAGIRDGFRLPIVEAPSFERTAALLDASLADLLHESSDPVDDLYLGEFTILIQQQATGAVQGLLAESGRRQVFAAGRADRKATKWARVTSPGACSFCRMLASRGAVYRFEDSADFRAHVKKNGRGGTCLCAVEPQFGQYEPTAQARADAALWADVAKGRSASDARNEFRRHVEGRAEGARRPRRRGARSVLPGPVARLGFSELTPAQLQHQLAILERLPDSAYRTKQSERVLERLAFLASSPA